MGRKHAYPALPQQTRPWNMGPEGLSGPTVNPQEMLLQWKFSSNKAFILRLDTYHGRDLECLCLHSVPGSPALNLLCPRGSSKTSAESVRGTEQRGGRAAQDPGLPSLPAGDRQLQRKPQERITVWFFPESLFCASLLCFTAFTDVFSEDRRP